MSQYPSQESLNAQANARSAAKRHVLASQFHSSNSSIPQEQPSKYSMLQDCGFTPDQIAFMSLQSAAKILDEDKVSALIAAGALLSLPEDSVQGSPLIKDRTPPLLLACRQKGPRAAGVVELLLKAGAGVNAVSTSGGQTALHIAAGGADPAVIGALLAAAADPSLRTQARELEGERRLTACRCVGPGREAHVTAEAVTRAWFRRG